MDKKVQETVDPTLTLGCEEYLRIGMVRADPKKIAILLSDTAMMIKRQKATSGELASLVGRRTNIMLLRRPTPAIFSVVYEKNHCPAKISKEIAAELHSAIQLAPLLTRSWYRPFQAILIAYDACLSGGVVVFSSVTAEVTEKYAHLNARTIFDFDGMADSVKQTARYNALEIGDLNWKLAVQLLLSHIYAHTDAHISFKEALMAT